MIFLRLENRENVGLIGEKHTGKLTHGWTERQTFTRHSTYLKTLRYT